MNPALFLEESCAAGKYLTFVLGGGAYGLPVLKVREIIRLVDITPIPRMPNYVRGVINLRGKIVPVIDLRLKLGLSNPVTTNRTCIIVTHVEIAGTVKLMGLIVDAIEEVVYISSEEIEAAPDFGKGVSPGFIAHLAKGKTQVRSLLDIDRIVQAEQAILASDVLAGR